MYGLLADSHITVRTYQVAREGSYNTIPPVTLVFNTNEESCRFTLQCRVVLNVFNLSVDEHAVRVSGYLASHAANFNCLEFILSEGYPK